MAKPSKFNELLQTLTADVVAHPHDLTRHYAERFGFTRAAANKYIQLLENTGWIARSGPSTRPVFSLGYKRRVSKLYELHGLEEYEAWGVDFKPYFNLTPNVQNIVATGFTEMVNNAIDHSKGKTVFVWVSQDEDAITVFISDDGIGIFEKIASALALPDKRLALFELSKGKFTTDPKNHSGEGVFFTSRMFDQFAISANDLTFSHLQNEKHDWLEDDPGRLKNGTTVSMRLALTSPRTASDIYEEFTKAPEDFNFSKTIVPMRLAAFGDEQLISRSQAKRLVARFDQFKRVVLDFEGILEVGQAFADELFRVYANVHQDVELIPQNMTEQVERMYLRAVSPRA